MHCVYYKNTHIDEVFLSFNHNNLTSFNNFGTSTVA